jgi:hypothetical protein
MARTCPSCGHENADDVDFCASCGGYVRWEPTRAAPAVPQPPAPGPAPAPPAPAAPPPAEQAPAQSAPVQEPPAEPVRKKSVPGVAGGGVSKPRVSGPRVQPPRVNVGPQGVNVSAPRVSGPRVAPPIARPPRLKQPRVPRTPKDVMKAFKKLPGGRGKGRGDSGAVAEGPVAPQPAETWHWDAVGETSGRGKGVLVFLLLLLFAGLAAAAGWWFFVRDDDEVAAAKTAPAATAASFATGLEPLLVRSSRDRARISSAVTRVASCSLAPGRAAQQIGLTVAGRRAVLVQVRRVRAPNAQLLRARRLLEQSLASSAAAGRGYSAWIASYDGACPARAGPEYATALAANGKAQGSKNAFVKAYNPVAKRVGARTWQSTQF